MAKVTLNLTGQEMYDLIEQIKNGGVQANTGFKFKTNSTTGELEVLKGTDVVAVLADSKAEKTFLRITGDTTLTSPFGRLDCYANGNTTVTLPALPAKGRWDIYNDSFWFNDLTVKDASGNTVVVIQSSEAFSVYANGGAWDTVELKRVTPPRLHGNYYNLNAMDWLTIEDGEYVLRATSAAEVATLVNLPAEWGTMSPATLFEAYIKVETSATTKRFSMWHKTNKAIPGAYEGRQCERLGTTGTWKHHAYVSDVTALTKASIGLGNVDNTSDANKPVSTATQTELDKKVNIADKGVADGVASLDASGKIPSTQLPTDVVTKVAGKTGVVTLVKADVGLDKVDNTTDLAKPISTLTQAALDLKVDKTKVDAANGVAPLDNNKKVPEANLPDFIPAKVQTELNKKVDADKLGAPSGVATLDAGGKIPSSQMSGLMVSDTYVVANKAARLAINNPAKGDMAIQEDTQETFILKQTPGSTEANWVKLLFPASVASVNGQTGVVSLTKNDLTLGNVDNTSDLNKPVSNDTKTELDKKVNIADIKDVLDDASTNKPLSANQGKVLKAEVDLKVAKTDIKDDLTSTDTDKPLSAKQGKELKTLIDANVPKSAYDAKGSILVATGAGTYAAVGVGANGKVLTADSTESSGVAWKTNTPVDVVDNLTTDDGTKALSAKQGKLLARAAFAGATSNITVYAEAAVGATTIRATKTGGVVPVKDMEITHVNLPANTKITAVAGPDANSVYDITLSAGVITAPIPVSTVLVASLPGNDGLMSYADKVKLNGLNIQFSTDKPLKATANGETGTATTVARSDHTHPESGIAVTNFTAKGDMLIGSGAASYGKVTLGTSGQVLTVDESNPSVGMKWASLPYATVGAKYNRTTQALTPELTKDVNLVAGGTVPTVGSIVKFANHATYYMVASVGTNKITLSAGLDFDVPNGTSALFYDETTTDGIIDFLTLEKINNSTSVGSATPQDLGTAAAGTSTLAARQDHVHKLPATASALITFYCRASEATAAGLTAFKIETPTNFVPAAGDTIAGVNIPANAKVVSYSSPTLTIDKTIGTGGIAQYAVFTLTRGSNVDGLMTSADKAKTLTNPSIGFYDWSKPYKSGDLCIARGMLIEANSDITPYTAFSWGTTGQTWKLKYDAGLTFRGPYKKNTVYNSGDLVTYSQYLVSPVVKIDVGFTSGNTEVDDGTQFNKDMMWGGGDYVNKVTVILGSASGINYGEYAMVAATSTKAGRMGAVYAPAAGQQNHFFTGSGWSESNIGSSIGKRRNGSFKLTSGSDTVVLFDSDDSPANHNTGNIGLSYDSGTGEFKNTSGGKVVYQIHYQIAFPSNGTGNRVSWIRYANDANNKYAMMTMKGFSTVDAFMSGSCTLALAANTVFHVMAFQDSGADMYIASPAFAGAAAGYHCRIQITRVSL